MERTQRSKTTRGDVFESSLAKLTHAHKHAPTHAHTHTRTQRQAHTTRELPLFVGQAASTQFLNATPIVRDEFHNGRRPKIRRRDITERRVCPTPRDSRAGDLPLPCRLQWSRVCAYRTVHASRRCGDSVRGPRRHQHRTAVRHRDGRLWVKETAAYVFFFFFPAVVAV